MPYFFSNAAANGRDSVGAIVVYQVTSPSFRAASINFWLRSAPRYM